MSFIAKFLDDREKSVNPVHVIMGLLVLSSIGWVSYIVFKTLKMPDLTGVAYLIGGGGAANLCQQATDIVAKFTNKPGA